MPRKKIGVDAELKLTGDPFFDTPTEEYWANEKNTVSLKPTKVHARKSTLEPPTYQNDEVDAMREFLDTYDAKMAEEAKGIEHLNQLMIPIPQLRMKLSEFQLSGVGKIPLGALLVEIHKIWTDSIINNEE